MKQEANRRADVAADRSIEDLCITTIRTLAMDAVQRANSGHPGTPMALAPLAYILWTRFLRYNPADPHWFDRDRFVLSAGHASMLLYAMLYLTGYDLSLDDIRNFRQWGSPTAGHPEYGLAPGVETTTGPLGQGLMNAVGMAMAEAHLAAVYNRAQHEVVNHHTYVICSDGDLMEGASHEAASLAGHMGLEKLIVIYDNNHITIEGGTDLTYSDDVQKRFESYGWQVQDIGDAANDLKAITKALSQAKAHREAPSLIIVRSHIAFGAPGKQDTSDAHGAPLGQEEVQATKRAYGWPEDGQFHVPEAVLDHMRQAIPRGKRFQSEWQGMLSAYKKRYPEEAARLQSAIAGKLSNEWREQLPSFSVSEGPMATRAASGKVLNAIAPHVPSLFGGSADLAPSTKSLIAGSGYFARGAYENPNVAWGVREHVMCAACTGMALHGGVRPYAATFFIFTDYARPAIRLAALMKQPVIYVMTHDSIGVGEDGPTHQPIEQLASLRAMPNMCVIRPADANETACAWRAALERTDGPTMLVLTRQNLPVLERPPLAAAEGVQRGAYVLSPEKGSSPDLILIASGSEVALVLEAQAALAADSIDSRVVSMPSWELFDMQPQNYREEVLPASVTARLAVEAAAPLGWERWIGGVGDVIGITTFGASAPARIIFEKYGFTVANVVSRARKLLSD